MNVQPKQSEALVVHGWGIVIAEDVASEVVLDLTQFTFLLETRKPDLHFIPLFLDLQTETIDVVHKSVVWIDDGE